MQNAFLYLLASGLLLTSSFAQAESQPENRLGDYPEGRVIAAARADRFIHGATQLFRVQSQQWTESIHVTTVVDGDGNRTYTVIFSFAPVLPLFGQAVGVVFDADLNPIVYILS